jgi:hypothetical protein
MINRCPSGKRIFESESLAEDALIDLWSKNNYSSANAPQAIYRCEDCGNFHFTSRGPMNAKLQTAISSGKIKIQREANNWLNKMNKKGFN